MEEGKLVPKVTVKEYLTVRRAERRRKFLLLAAASALEEGVSPFGPAFRAAYEVTVAEGAIMVEGIAYSIRYWVADKFGEETA